MPERPFHDYLQLASQDLTEPRTLVFCGRSGSGKSSYLRWLSRDHAQCARAQLVDELVNLAHFRQLWREFPATGPVLVASHLPAAWHFLLRPLGPLRIVRLDRRREKLARIVHEHDTPSLVL